MQTNLVHFTWIVSAVLIILLAVALGRLIRRDWLGILVDSRGRYSLTQLQIAVWTIVILSLISGVFWARILTGTAGALDFTMPDELLLVMGISIGSTAAAIAVKAGKDAARPAAIAASDAGEPRRLSQIFLVEEGEFADQIVDVTKFQSFWITGILVVAYVALAVSAIGAAGTPAALTALPGFSGTFVTLLGISHAGYLAGKIPDRPGTPKGLSLQMMRHGAVAILPGGGPTAIFPGAVTYQPRTTRP